MNPPQYNYAELISEKLQDLSLDKQQAVLNFIEFLALKEQDKKSQLGRVPDLHQGKIWISDDFNEPLPDSFWLGEE